MKGAKKQIFWQTSIEYQRPNLRMLVNNIEIEEMVNTGADGTIIFPKSWPISCHFKKQTSNFKELGPYPKQSKVPDGLNV